MRWFTDGVYEADDAGWERTLAGYRAHIASISARLPADLLALATEPRFDLHDARFREVRVDADAAEVDMVIERDEQGGPRQISLRFGSATIVPENLWLLAEAVSAEFRANHWHRDRTVTRILAHEVDLGPDDRFALRLRLSPFHEFAVEFESCSLSETSLPERRSRRAGRFILGTR